MEERWRIVSAKDRLRDGSRGVVCVTEKGIYGFGG